MSIRLVYCVSIDASNRIFFFVLVLLLFIYCEFFFPICQSYNCESYFIVLTWLRRMHWRKIKTNLLYFLVQIFYYKNKTRLKFLFVDVVIREFCMLLLWILFEDVSNSREKTLRKVFNCRGNIFLRNGAFNCF